MAYDPANPPTRVAGGVGQTSLWVYVSGDDAATVAGEGYFTNGQALGMRATDPMFVVENTPVGVTLHAVASIAADGSVTVSGVTEPPEPEMLAKIDFASGAYEVGGVSKTLGQVITGGTFSPGSVSPGDGWFPSDDEFGFFGTAMLPVIGRAEGFCVVVHSEGQASRPQNITLTFANDAFTAAVTGVFHAGTNDALGMNDVLSDPLITPIDTVGVLGEGKHALRISPAQFAGQITTTSEVTAVPAEGQFGTWGSQSFVEAGASSYKILSLEFWTPDKALSELVAL